MQFFRIFLAILLLMERVNLFSAHIRIHNLGNFIIQYCIMFNKPDGQSVILRNEVISNQLEDIMMWKNITNGYIKIDILFSMTQRWTCFRDEIGNSYESYASYGHNIIILAGDPHNPRLSRSYPSGSFPLPDDWLDW